jgi:hypothetical protein
MRQRRPQVGEQEGLAPQLFDQLLGLLDRGARGIGEFRYEVLVRHWRASHGQRSTDDV